MPVLNNKPVSSRFQVGENVHYIESNILKSGIIKKIESIVNNPQDNSNGKQSNLYYVSENIISLPEEKLFATQNLLFKSLKGNYVSDFSSIDFGTSNISGRDFSGVNLSNANLSQIDPDVTNLDVRGTTFEGASLREGLDTKEDFTSLTDFYDNTTIWVDGTSIVEE